MNVMCFDFLTGITEMSYWTISNAHFSHTQLLSWLDSSGLMGLLIWLDLVAFCRDWVIFMFISLAFSRLSPNKWI